MWSSILGPCENTLAGLATQLNRAVASVLDVSGQLRTDRQNADRDAECASRLAVNGQPPIAVNEAVKALSRSVARQHIYGAPFAV